MTTVSCGICGKSYKSDKVLYMHRKTKHPEAIRAGSKAPIYYENPKHCEQCYNIIPYEKRRNRFCSNSCSATATNLTRESVHEKLKQTWRSTRGSLRAERPKLRDSLRICCCGSTFTPRGAQHKYCKPTCNVSKLGKIRYRSLCRFNLNKNDHINLFDKELLAKHGWYVPSNKGNYNPDGATWDHLYRVADGFARGVDPAIMSHPANAEMISWRENFDRKTSKISLEELLQRIDNW